MQQSPKRGGNVKKAPPGFYTLKEAKNRLGVTQNTLQSLVKKGQIERIVPPFMTDGYYRIQEVNKLADQQAIFYLQNISTNKYEPTEFARATIDDADGIYNVIASLWGADKATPVELRRTFYRANDKIDYVVKFRGCVLGYINMIPYEPNVLEETMSGRKRGWDIRPHDILSFESGKSYDIVVGIAVRQDIPGHEYYAKRLIIGFFGALHELAKQNIIIRHMYATSDQPFGIKISQDLGFERQPAKPEDLFIRFELDMEKANTLLVRKYREALQNQQNSPVPQKTTYKKIAHDPHLEDTLQQVLDTLSTIDISQHAEVINAFLSLVDQLAESSQMSVEQQVLLRSIHEITRSQAR